MTSITLLVHLDQEPGIETRDFDHTRDSDGRAWSQLRLTPEVGVQVMTSTQAAAIKRAAAAIEKRLLKAEACAAARAARASVNEAAAAADPAPAAAADQDRCDVDWGSAAPSQRCTLSAGHRGKHVDGIGKSFGSEENPPPLSRDLSGDLMGLPGGRAADAPAAPRLYAVSSDGKLTSGPVLEDRPGVTYDVYAQPPVSAIAEDVDAQRASELLGGSAELVPEVTYDVVVPGDDTGMAVIAQDVTGDEANRIAARHLGAEIRPRPDHLSLLTSAERETVEDARCDIEMAVVPEFDTVRQLVAIIDRLAGRPAEVPSS